ncbi:protein mab-21-like 3 [Ptychodera flava]|uniref:protein mab-21-like 3 n=1 Tax=Ptychodera flava TaxID=63121 RepID=UPI00396A02DD
MYTGFTDESEEFCVNLRNYATTRARVDDNAESDAVQELQELLVPIMKFVHKKDRRFNDDVVAVGSYALNKKVIESESADFEFLVPILGLPDPKWSFNDRPRLYDYTSLMGGKSRLIRRHRTKPLPEPKTGQHFLWIEDRAMGRSWNDWIFNRDLIPCKVTARLRELVEEAILDGQSKGAVALLPKQKENSPIRLRIHFSLGAVHAVLRPTVLSEGGGFPSEVHSEWPRIHLWPPAYKLKELRKIGTDSVAVEDLYWTQSYARCEQALIKSIDRDGGCRKVCLRIMEQLREEHWCSGLGRGSDSGPPLTYYHLQTLLLWHCEEWCSTVDWLRVKLPIRFISIVRRLMQWVENRRCPHYFLSSVNLFEDERGKLLDEEGLRAVEENIRMFIKSPNFSLRESTPPNVDLPDILKDSPESTLRQLDDET